MVALLSYFILPNFPSTTSWLSSEERIVALRRIKDCIGEESDASNNREPFFTGFKQAIRDNKTWLLMVAYGGCVSASSVTRFFPSVVATLGYSNVTSLLLTAPPYGLAIITTAAVGYHADLSGERYFHLLGCLVVALVAFVITASTTTFAPRYLGIMLMPASIYPAFSLVLTWSSQTLSQTAAKRAAALAMVNLAGNATDIYSSYLYGTKWAPQYVLAMSFNAAAVCITIGVATILRSILLRANLRLEPEQTIEGADHETRSADTDRRNGFRFII